MLPPSNRFWLAHKEKRQVTRGAANTETYRLHHLDADCLFHRGICHRHSFDVDLHCVMASHQEQTLSLPPDDMRFHATSFETVAWRQIPSCEQVWRDFRQALGYHREPPVASGLIVCHEVTSESGAFDHRLGVA